MRVSDPIRLLRWVAFGAAAALTASGEYYLAGLAGWPSWVAWLLPVALDVYAFTAFATHRRADTLAALGLMIAANTIYHLAATDIVPAGWQLVVTVAAAPPIICWRVHHLGETPPLPETSPATEAPAPEIPPRPTAEAPTQARTDSSGRPQHGNTQRNASRPTSRPTARRRYRPLAETRALAQQIENAQPDITRQALADKLGITTRQLRNVLHAV